MLLSSILLFLQSVRETTQLRIVHYSTYGNTTVQGLLEIKPKKLPGALLNFGKATHESDVSCMLHVLNVHNFS